MTRDVFDETRRYLTAELPGIGGEIKREPDDFRVEELPLYDASGQGDHVYLTLEKRGIDTLGAIRRLSTVLRVPERRFGYAGIKDAQALTVQRVSVEGVDPSRVESLGEIPGLRVLGVDRHTNKLKLGHHRGNRFEVRVRDSHPDALNRTLACLRALAEKGVANFFGPQRFGRFDNTDRLGRAWLLGQAETVFDLIVDPEGGRGRFQDPAPLDAYRKRDFQVALDRLPSSAIQERRSLQALIRSRGDFVRALSQLDRRLMRLALSAYQSRLFNRVLSERMPVLSVLMVGDLAYLHGRGAVFTVEDLEREQPRADAFEISPSGPLFGSKMIHPEGEPGRIESRILDREGLPAFAWRPLRKLGMKGGRRPLRVPLEDGGALATEDGVLVSFSLPPGAYATVVLEEIMKGG